MSEVIVSGFHQSQAMVGGVSVYRFEIGDKLYTTDHAEELAKALEKVRTMLFYLPSSSLNEDVLEILGYIDDKVFNYREATK
jgi:hypothetical protein